MAAPVREPDTGLLSRGNPGGALKALPDDVIRDVVLRQPRDWLGAKSADLIVECLLARREHLRRVPAANLKL